MIGLDTLVYIVVTLLIGWTHHRNLVVVDRICRIARNRPSYYLQGHTDRSDCPCRLVPDFHAPIFHRASGHSSLRRKPCW